MTLAPETLAAAESHIRRIVGPTILMGDGSYFDYDAPDLTTMTIEDYAWGLLTPRFRCQTRASDGTRCLYFVLQHVCEMAMQMVFDGCCRDDAYAGLMHESDEVVFGDPPGPIKSRYPDLKRDLKQWSAGIDARFGVFCSNPDLIKRYDLRMLATEKRDLMPQGAHDRWPIEDEYAAFDARITPWDAETCLARFDELYEFLKP